MMKFFRRYNKQLLAFFMALLMIVFIGGSALQGMLRPDPNFDIAKSSLGSISQKDQRIATSETQILESIGQNWQHPLFGDTPITTMDWILLSREAEKMGISIDEKAIETSPSFPANEINSVARRLRMKPSMIVNAMAKLQAIRQAAVSIATAATPSEAEVISAARNSMERAKIRAVLLPAEAFVDKNASFSDAEIKAQFDKYKDREPGQGLQFGYYQKPGIKVQYIKVDRDIVASNVRIPNEERKAKAYYEENKAKDAAFRRKPEELTAPPEGPQPTPYVDWEQAKDAAVAKLRKDTADKDVQQIVDWLLSTMNDSWIGATVSESGYKQPPAEVTSLEYYEKMIKRLPGPLQFGNAVTVHSTDFFTQQDATKVPEIGSLSVRSGSSLIARSFGSVAFENEAIIPSIPKNEKVNASEYIAKFQTSPLALTDSRTGNAYLFRVIDAKPGGPSESVDQVRERIIADLRLQKGFEAAKARAHSLGTCTEPLKDAYEADPDLAAFRQSAEGPKTGFFEPPAFSRIGQTPAYRQRPADGIFAGGGLGKLPNETVDAIFAMAHGADKIAVFELPERAATLVVELVEIVPPQEEEFAGSRKELSTRLADNRWRELVNDWFDPEKIRARNGFELIRSR